MVTKCLAFVPHVALTTYFGGITGAVQVVQWRGNRVGKRVRSKGYHTPIMSATPLDETPIEGTVSTDWRQYRAHLVATHRTKRAPFVHHCTTHLTTEEDQNPNDDAIHWAHALPHVEVGACLIASPSHKWPPSFAHLQKAVILVTMIKPTKMSGILLNRPTQFQVGTHTSALARAGREFSNNRIMLGGDCSTGTLEVLHPFSPTLCAGATQIIPGLSRGGFNAARKLVSEGIASSNDFHFFVAYSKWTSESFSAEFERGAWNVVACSSHLLLSDQNRHENWLWTTLNSFT